MDEHNHNTQAYIRAAQDAITIDSRSYSGMPNAEYAPAVSKRQRLSDYAYGIKEDDKDKPQFSGYGRKELIREPAILDLDMGGLEEKTQ